MLKDFDQVAYIRFASVYRQFKDINTFMDELAKLLGEKIMLNPAGFYGKVITLALSNTEEEYDLSDI